MTGMTMKLSGRRALVTGGSDGIGLAIAKALAQRGAHVCIVGRDKEKLDAAMDVIGRESSQSIAADLSKEEGVQAVVNTLSSQTTSLDILVNNAGTSVLVPFKEATTAEFQLSVNLNIASAYFLTQGLLPLMEHRAASIINISSYFAGKMLPGRPSTLYSLTKGAINSLTKSLAYELGPSGIRVNAIAPGTVDTPLRRRTIEVLPPEARHKLQAYVDGAYPLGRIGRPDDLAGIAVFLAGDDSSWTTGGIFPVDGGLTSG